MPELPEVQTIVNDLNAAGLRGRTIDSARVFWARTIAEPSARAFCSRIKGRTIAAIKRRGKFIVFGFQNGGHLLMHLRMSGRLHLVTPDQPRKKHEHVLLDLSGGQQLRFHDTRKFGRLYLTADAAQILNRLGPEPLSRGFTQTQLAAGLKPRKRLLKPLLLDQSFIAGLGNIYVDEALWESKVHPCRRAASLSATEIRALYRAIPRVLKRGLKNLGTSLGTGETNFYSVARHQGRNRDQLNVFRRTGQPCPRCRTEIERIIVGQRSTHICPLCQRI
ncbi:MAG: bifunctional DNA-formamidopyrimidine glycosylase/DNA-(apurinic or apyrimidinic site) lyase [Desulfobacterales bacterium]|nr:bifunctional DNA-formamidopyrimidine glycosylase/DNA-(apurinic or apyrimidinic site) lyase [Desulfobacterales bacterium]